MATFEGSRSRVGETRRADLSEEEIRGIIAARVPEAIREATPLLFRLVNTMLIEGFD